MGLARLLLTWVLLWLLPAAGWAQDWSQGEFDARLLSLQEKRIVQAALVWSGDYSGLLDGAWGKGSQRALERYTIRTFGSDKPTFAEIGPLLADFEAEWRADGWLTVPQNDQNFSYAHPFGLLNGPTQDPSAPNVHVFASQDKALLLYIYFHPVRQAISLHDELVAMAHDPNHYSSATADRLISSVTYPDGSVAYVRSNALGNQAVTYAIFGGPSYKPVVALMASSMQRGVGTPLSLRQDSLLWSLMPKPKTEPETGGAAEVAALPVPAPEATAPIPAEGPADDVVSTGTGFFVNRTSLVTAAHVVRGCRGLRLADGTGLVTVKLDTDLDLAVLAAPKPFPHWLLLSPETQPSLGEGATALGFPYLGTLGQGQTATNGNISALNGIDGATDRIMVSAPVQPGNSGGPLLDSKAAVIGVVVSRVDDVQMLKTTGTLPQNMNFAVPNGPLTEFLTGAGVSFSTEPTGAELKDGLPKAVTAATVAIYCLG